MEGKADVNAIQQWTGDALLVFGNDSRRTPTGLLGVRKPTTWSEGIHNRMFSYKTTGMRDVFVGFIDRSVSS